MQTVCKGEQPNFLLHIFTKGKQTSLYQTARAICPLPKTKSSDSYVCLLWVTDVTTLLRWPLNQLS